MPSFLQENEVLHVTCTDLDHVNIFNSCFNGIQTYYLADGRKTGSSLGFLHIFQTFLLQSLKGIGRGAGLVGSATQYGGTGCFDRLCDRHQLGFSFHCTGTCHNGQIAGADGSVSNLHSCRLRMKLFVCQLVAFRNGKNAVNILKNCEILGRYAGFVTYHTDDGNLLAL